MNYKEKYNDWLSFADGETKSELLAAAGNEKDVEDRFYKDLAFGTGGLRGIMGAGSNRMNIYTVGRATLGLAAYIKNKFKANCSVAVAYDPVIIRQLLRMPLQRCLLTTESRFINILIVCRFPCFHSQQGCSAALPV